MPVPIQFVRSRRLQRGDPEVDHQVSSGYQKHGQNPADQFLGLRRAAENNRGGERRVHDVQLEHQKSGEERNPLGQEEAAVGGIDVSQQKPYVDQEEQSAQKFVID